MPCVCVFNSLEDNYNITIKKQVRTFECDNTTIEYRNSSRMFKCRILIGTSVVLELFWCLFFWCLFFLFSKMVDNISEPISEDIEVEFQNTKNKGDNQTVFLTFIPKVHGLWLFWLAFFLSLYSLTGYFGVCMYVVLGALAMPNRAVNLPVHSAPARPRKMLSGWYAERREGTELWFSPNCQRSRSLGGQTTQ